MKTIIAGCRHFTNYDVLQWVMDIELPHVTEVVSGECRGTDRMGERWAAENNIPVKGFPADWDKFGKSAGYRRNLEMAEYGDKLVAFWDCKSRGTKHMIDAANARALIVKVIKI